MDWLRHQLGIAATGPNLPPALRSILCGPTGELVWKRDAYDVAFITFREDGTGDLHFALQTAIYIASQFRWKVGPGTPEIPQLGRTATPTATPTAEPATDDAAVSAGGAGGIARPLQTVQVEITLTKRLMAGFEAAPGAELPRNENMLTDEAFRPRMYTLRLEQGTFAFPRPASVGGRREYRLEMDPSPFPPRHMWKKPEGGVDTNRPWEWTTFVGGAQVE